MGDVFCIIYEFSFVLVEFSGKKKGLTHQKSGQAVGVLGCGVETHASAKAHAKVWPNGRLVKPRVRRGVAELRHSEGLRRSVAVLRRNEAIVHSMENFCVFVLFRFHCSKDSSIGQMRTL